MLAALRAKSQITLPKSIVERLGFSAGDKFSVSEKEGVIYLTPVAKEVNSTWAEEFVELQGSVDDDTFTEPENISFSEREAL